MPVLGSDFSPVDLLKHSSVEASINSTASKTELGAFGKYDSSLDYVPLIGAAISFDNVSSCKVAYDLSRSVMGSKPVMSLSIVFACLRV
jgi:hypothetical protein